MIRYGNMSDYRIVNKIANQGQEYHFKLRPDIYMLENDKNKVLSFDKYCEMVDEKNIIVYVVDNSVVAYMAFKDKKNDNPLMKKSKAIFIDSVAVEENYRGRGVATELMKWIKIYAKQNEYEKIELQVNGKNDIAISYYQNEEFGIKSINMEFFV